MNQINWYPGHMAKARRLLAEQLKNVDLVVELCDARLPHSSRNPDLGKMLEGRKRILLMNKADLADPEATRQWISFLREVDTEAYPCSIPRLKPAEAIRTLENAVREKVEKAAAKGMRKTVRVMVAGVPNVGKSTYINRLHGGSVAAAGDHPGVTKSNQWVRINPWLELLDTPGLLWPRLDDQEAARKLCYIGTVRDEILDLEELACFLMEDLSKMCPDTLKDRYRISDTTLKGADLLEEACRGRGFLLKGGVPDVSRCASVVLDEFRAGKLGRITLEVPPRTGMEEHDDESAAARTTNDGV